MCGGGSRLQPQARLPEAPVSPSATGAETQTDRDRRRRSARGGTGTILTGSSGVTSAAPTQQKTLLGG